MIFGACTDYDITKLFFILANVLFHFINIILKWIKSNQTFVLWKMKVEWSSVLKSIIAISTMFYCEMKQRKFKLQRKQY